MRTMVVRAALAAAVAAATMGTVLAMSAEDDLAVVKRAVAGPQVARQEPPAKTAPEADEPVTRAVEKDDWERRNDGGPRPTGGEVRWFKIRVTEKGAKKARVNVNLPIALVRALGDDFPIEVGRHSGWRGGHHKAIRLGEVLATLEAGQSLVEVDDDHATVRIWVD